MPRCRPLALLLLFLVATAPPSAAARPDAYDAAGATFEDAAVLAGSLTALRAQGPQADDGAVQPTRQLPTFTLEADQVDATEYRLRHDLSVGGVPAGEPQADAVPHALGPSRITVAEARDDFEIFAAGAPGALNQAALRASGMAVEPSADARLAMAHLAEHPDGDGPARDVADAARARPADGTLYLEGDFVLSLWSVDVRVEGAGPGGTLLRSGYFRSETVDLPPPLLGVGSSEEVRLDLVVRGGRLTLPLGADWDAPLYVEPEAAATAGRIALSDALPLGDGGLASPRLEVAGPVGALFQPIAGGRLRLSLEPIDAGAVEEYLSEPARLAADGLAPASPSFGTPGLRLAAAAAALAAAALLVRLQVRRRRLHRLQELFEQGRYDEVPGPARRALGGPRGNEAAVMMAVSLLKTGRIREAERFLDSPRGQAATDPAARDFLGACVKAIQGDLKGSEARLLRCFRQDPAYVQEAVHTRWLEDVLARKAFRHHVAPRAPEGPAPEAYI